MNNNPKLLLKMINDQQDVIQQLKQEVLAISKKYSRTRITQTLLLSILMKYDPNLLDFFKGELSKMEEETGYNQTNAEEVILLKKVLNDINKIALKSKKSP